MNLSLRRAIRINVIDRCQRPVRRAGSLTNRDRAARETVEDRGDAHDLVAGVAHGLDRLQRRAARRDDVLDDQAAIAGLEQRALDAALKAVLLALLAHEERLDVGAR